MKKRNGVKSMVRAARMGRRAVWATAAALVLIGLTAPIAAAAGLGQETTTTGSQLWPVLLPLVAAAASVERAVELGWNYVEWGLLRFAGWRPSDLKSASYGQFKSGTSLLAGVVLGVVVVNFSSMRLMAHLQPLIPTFFVGDASQMGLWDVLITGAVVGAGSKPAHDILGIITQLKNFTGNSAIKQREQAGAALAEGIMKLGGGEAPAAYNIDVPGMGPSAVGGSAATARSRMLEESGGRSPSEVNVERYAKAIHDSLYG
ncbi:MAG: hypothetical protein KF753_23380 [Caldilineaceae bacterium]|nr:hypothetical protein [Caldilineaceae bacterium]